MTKSKRGGGWSWLLVPAFLLATAPVFAKDPDVSPAAVDAAWKKFLAEADAEAVYDAYSEAFKAEDDDQKPSAQGCREHADALERAVATVPVGLSIHYLAYRCADLLGDESGAERHLAWFGALARHALASAPADWSSPPIRVVVGRDIYALLEASGLEFRYQSLETQPQERYLIIQVAAWDPEDKRERHLLFDFTDTYVQLSRDDANAVYPAFRKAYQDNVVRHFVDQKQIMGLDLDAARRASASEDPAEKVTLLRPIAEIGGVHAAHVWLLTCHREPFAGCGEGLVDALLPFVEKGHGTPTVLLSLAYAHGIGVDKDERASLALLDAADRAMGPGRASLDFARYQLGMKQPFSAALLERLDKAARRDLPAATVLLALAREDAKTSDWTDADREAVQVAARGGSVAATIALAQQLHDRADDAQALEWLVKAAHLGDPYSQDVYSTRLADGDGVKADPDAAAHWRRQAAAGGDVDAMTRLGWDAWAARKGPEAERWLISAVMYGSQQAMFELVELYSEGLEGMRFGAARAIEILKSLEDTENGAKARRYLADFHLRGVGVDKDPEKARTYYLKDAQDGDRESQTLLGLGMMRGDFGDPEPEAGEAWVQKAIDAGYVDAIDGLAFYYFYEVGENAGRARAVQMWRSALDAKDNALVLNNLAWVLCTTPHADVADREEGGRVARRLGEEDFLPSGQVDTLAACHAANGRFAEAVAKQEEAIADLVRFAPDDDSLEGMRARLALYRSGKPYVETGDP
ncbi:tetratricopeptide repeat protein [Arenimonas terrae]|jgi:TPR repeat protein|uniref:Sel1 repeat family protein n=1 Tax=Arenimonas terrae TaxID=2546226 RepID=A0A5C4RSD8_9GAMM|nr:tetratricopeptide repeat protein [Arenimonas terrae]TNJ33761.1 sel1 repeat family protein [Arenimonas terrae]